MTDDPFAAPRPGARPPDGSPPPEYGQQSLGYGPPPGPAPQGYGPGWSPVPRTEPKAMIALGLAIAAYTPTIPFVGAIAAIVLAHLARRDILASGGRLTGLSLCTWALVLSWVHLVLIALAVVVVIVVFLLPFSLL